MKSLLSLTVSLLFATIASAQSPALPAAEKSDPEAKKVLDKVRKKYAGYKTVEAAFSLTIEVPNQPREVQKGKVSQQGKKFRLDMTDQTIASDGVTTWVYLKKNKEIQINNADPQGDAGFLTPQELLSRYEKGDYLYSVVDRSTENGKVVTHIEFKPRDRNSEYSKLRVSVDEKTATLNEFRAFAKDGSRFTFRIDKLTPNPILAADHFSLDPKAYPGARVEDLRM